MRALCISVSSPERRPGGEDRDARETISQCSARVHLRARLQRQTGERSRHEGYANKIGMLTCACVKLELEEEFSVRKEGICFILLLFSFRVTVSVSL